VVESAAISIEALRARIRAIEGHSVTCRRWKTGVRELDELLGGVPTPGWMEVTGPAGSGRLALALSVAAQVTQAGQWVAWLDGDRTFYPPGARLQGVVLERLALVRPVADRGAWAADILVSSGCFPWVVITGNVSLGRAGARWTQAAERGHCCVCVVRQHSERRLPANVRLQVLNQEMRVVRNRGGEVGGRAQIPSWLVDPWA